MGYFFRCVFRHHFWKSENFCDSLRKRPLKMASAGFRSLLKASSNVLANAASRQTLQVTAARCMSAKKPETDAEFAARYEAYFNRKDIDGWEIRKAMGDLHGMDLVPEPTIVAAALRACRRVNDYALTTRILEIVQFKSQAAGSDVWPYMVQELTPTLGELGISLPEQLGYDKPELALPNPYEIH